VLVYFFDGEISSCVRTGRDWLLRTPELAWLLRVGALEGEKIAYESKDLYLLWGTDGRKQSRHVAEP
jgi:hypothetical protein